jgi:hypothetical protein
MLDIAGGGTDRAIRVSTAAVVLAVAGIAAYISYWHAYAVVREGTTTPAWVAGSMRAVADSDDRAVARRARYPAYACLSCGISWCR